MIRSCSLVFATWRCFGAELALFPGFLRLRCCFQRVVFASALFRIMARDIMPRQFPFHILFLSRLPLLIDAVNAYAVVAAFQGQDVLRVSLSRKSESQKL